MARLQILSGHFNSCIAGKALKTPFCENTRPGTGRIRNEASENVILSEGDKECTEIDMVRLTGIIIS